jgi:hypothetical protein
MPYTIFYNQEAHRVETKVTGTVTFDEFKVGVYELEKICSENDCFLCLTDYREARLGLSTFEIYSLPKKIADILSEVGGSSVHKFRRAVVVSKNDPDFSFYETVCINSGQYIKLFENIEDAKQWLSEQQKRPNLPRDTARKPGDE